MYTKHIITKHYIALGIDVMRFTTTLQYASMDMQNPPSLVYKAPFMGISQPATFDDRRGKPPVNHSLAIIH